MATQTIISSAITPLKKYFDFAGRAGRKEFWAFFFLCSALEVVLMYFEVAYGFYFSNIEAGLFSTIFSFITFIPFLAVAVRRFHDINKPAWHLLWVFIPFLGAVALFALWLRPSQPTSNPYGIPT